MTAQDSSNATRISLIQRAAEHDPQAWREMVELYGSLIAYWCRKCGQDEHSTADCVQEVFASVAKSLQRFEFRRETGAFRGWLWQITRNKLRDAKRRMLSGAEPIGGSTAHASLQEIVDPDSIPVDEPSELHELQQLMRRALSQIQVDFAPHTWQIFWRSAIDHVPTDIVASELGVTPAAVRQVRSRVLRRLREQLGDV